MATKTVKVSDLTGEIIEGERELARLVVEEHPDVTENVTLEVKPSEIEDSLPEEQEFVLVTYHPPTDSGESPQRRLLTVEQFNSLSQTDDMGAVLNNALLVQQEEERKRRGRRGRRKGEGSRRRVDYTSPEHAGEPHRGRITEAEKEYVQNHLEEVNRRLSEQGLRLVDRNDPDMVERYGLTSSN